MHCKGFSYLFSTKNNSVFVIMPFEIDNAFTHNAAGNKALDRIVDIGIFLNKLIEITGEMHITSYLKRVQDPYKYMLLSSKTISIKDG